MTILLSKSFFYQNIFEIKHKFLFVISIKVKKQTNVCIKKNRPLWTQWSDDLVQRRYCLGDPAKPHHRTHSTSLMSFNHFATSFSWLVFQSIYLITRFQIFPSFARILWDLFIKQILSTSTIKWSITKEILFGRSGLFGWSGQATPSRPLNIAFVFST